MSVLRIFGMSVPDDWPPPFFVPPCFRPGHQVNPLDPLEAELRELVEKGLTQNQMAYKLCVSASKISNMLKELGLNAQKLREHSGGSDGNRQQNLQAPNMANDCFMGYHGGLIDPGRNSTATRLVDESPSSRPRAPYSRFTEDEDELLLRLARIVKPRKGRIALLAKLMHRPATSVQSRLLKLAGKE